LKNNDGSAVSEEQAALILRHMMDTDMPSTITCAQNLGKFDFFPKMSGKGNAVRYMLYKRGLHPSQAVALFDDDNDLPMAYEVGHCCVMQCTHGGVAEAVQQNPDWVVAKQKGPLAADEVLSQLLEEAMKADLAAMKGR
jgi:hydroxymethylpyrimidine pyrophosphatase-like HAD family hydrolase